jgi:hypothetical protein
MLRPALDTVLRESVMVPLGASDTWRRHGYADSYPQAGAERVAVVSGGAHWGNEVQRLLNDVSAAVGTPR